MNWSDLGAAFALYLILEGIFPFMNPQALKRTLLALTQLQDRQLRIFGLVSMLAGIALLYLVHS
ncbi:MAG TPA: DUF2065 domain-containing protein [Steroidobacteraceae bacterium]|nr:DUF2065 domain-containing protein [Steroidobacteraceae bacterium]